MQSLKVKDACFLAEALQGSPRLCVFREIKYGPRQSFNSYNECLRSTYYVIGTVPGKSWPP